jgi:oligopeptide/dipeptide ABC transporter ATP-binding protein
MGMAIILITHDLGVIADMCDDVVVMYAGRVAEAGPVQTLFAAPRASLHPRPAEFDSAPDHAAQKPAPIIEGMVPSLAELPAGCRFQNRCPYRIDACATQPALRRGGSGAPVRLSPLA